MGEPVTPTPDQRAEWQKIAAVKRAREVLSPANSGPTVFGSTAWWRNAAKEVSEALLAASDENERGCNILRETLDERNAALLAADRMRAVVKAAQAFKPKLDGLRRQFPPCDSWLAAATCTAKVEFDRAEWDRLEVLRVAIEQLAAKEGA